MIPTPAYPESLLRIDDAMVALGRPVPPVVSWLGGRMKGAQPREHVRNEPETCPCRWCVACRDWRTKLAAWEAEDLERAHRWLELRETYKAEEERLERLKSKNDDQWNYSLLARLGAPTKLVDRIQRPLEDRFCFRAAGDWLRDGTQWSMILIGGTGCGKSTAALWAAHQLMMRSFRPRWVDCSRMVDAPMFGAEAELEKRLCREAGVLVLDDLCSSARERDLKKAPAPWMDWLDHVLGHRHGNSRKTIITSNRPADWLAGWLGDRLADRLNEGAIQISPEGSMRGQR